MKMKKHILTSHDLTTDDLTDIFSRANSYSTRSDGKHHGFVLGLCFFSESTRTANSLKSAAIKIGGGWVGMESVRGTYVESKSESAFDTVVALADVCDIIAIRGPGNPDDYRKLGTPVLNAMIGNDHTIGAIWRLFSLQKHFKSLIGLKVGFYGMMNASIAMRYLLLWARYGMHFYEESIIESAACLETVRRQVAANGSTWERASLEEMLSTVDFLLVTEAPSTSVPAESLDQFVSNYRVVNMEILSRLSSGARWSYIMPRTIRAELMTVSPEADAHPKLILRDFIQDTVWCNCGIFSKMLAP